MVQNGGRFGGLVLNLHLLRGMSLRGADTAAVFGNGEPFFVVGRHDFHQHFARDAKAGAVVEIGFCQQLVYVRPTVFIECQPDLLGTVPQIRLKNLLTDLRCCSFNSLFCIILFHAHRFQTP